MYKILVCTHAWICICPLLCLCNRWLKHLYAFYWINTGIEWKKKWRNQRDTYVKKRREMKSGKSKKANKWRYLDMLSFLDQHIYIEENRYKEKHFTDFCVFFKSLRQWCILKFQKIIPPDAVSRKLSQKKNSKQRATMRLTILIYM